MRIFLSSVLLFFTLFVAIGCTQETTTQEYTTWGLPDGAKTRLGKGEIAAIQFSPDGSLLAVASSVGIWLYDTETGKELALLPRNREGFNVSVVPATGGTFIRNSLAFSPDGKLLASACEDDTIRVFDVTTYTELRTLYKSDKIVVNSFAGAPYKSLTFSPDGERLISLEGTGERRIKVWDVNSGALLSDISGRIGGLPLEKNEPGVLAKVEVSTDPNENKKDNPLLALTLSPDGSSFATTKSKTTVIDGIPISEIKFGNVHTGELDRSIIITRLIPENTNPDQQRALIYPIRDLMFSQDGTTLAGIAIRNSREKNRNSRSIRHTKIRFWYVSTGDEVSTITLQKSEVGPRSPKYAFSPDGRTFVTVDKGTPIQLWDVSTGKEISSIIIPEPKPGNPWQVTEIVQLAFHPDGNTLVVVIDETGNGRNFSLQLWDTKTGKIKKVFSEHPMQYTFSANEKFILCFNTDKVEIRNTSNGQKLRDVTKWWTNLFRETNIETFAVSTDIAICATGGKRGLLELWNTNKGKRLQTLIGHTDIVKVVAFSDDGSKLASGSKDKSIRIWDTQSGKQLLSLTAHINSGKVQEYSNAPPITSAEVIDNLVFSHDGTMLASSSEYGTVWIWDLATEKLIKTITSHEDVTDPTLVGIPQLTIRLALSPDGRLLASGNMAGGLILSDIHNDAFTQSFESHSGGVVNLAFSPDGKLLASGSLDTSINIYDVENRTQLTTLRGHTSVVISLTFSEDSKTLVSGSADGTVLFWDRDRIVGLGR